MTVTFIAIAGASGSGKTTLARHLAHHLGQAPVIGLDRYYRDYSHLPLPQRAALNFDHPDSLNLEKFSADLRAWYRGETVCPPDYDFVRHCPRESAELIRPAPLMIVEGILVLHRVAWRQLFQLAIYMDTPMEECLQRRIERDIRQRGRSRESVIRQFRETVQPMTRKYVWPQRDYADWVVNSDDSLSATAARVQAFLADRLCQR